MSDEEFIRGKRRKELSKQSEQFKSYYNNMTYVRVPLAFYQLMTPEEAQILSYLWSLRQLLEHADELDDGWFYCTQKRLEKALGYRRRPQDRAFKLLQKRKLLSVERRGIPAKRYIKLHRKRIMEICERWHDLGEQADVVDEMKRLVG